MKRFLSISVLLQSITAAMAIGLVVVCGLGVQKAFERKATAERVLSIVQVSRDLTASLQELRLERGGLRNALSMTPAAEATVLRLFEQRRADCERHLQAALALLASDPSPDVQAALPELRARHDAFLTVRE